ncbi:hypothetical protein [Zavarzinia sp. CC-PAN008]|uniref:hypothetical protein n=1 Tax=Zavarzinia sp. CC-PAN008 TaxID=3243332 RepID=UPI003F745984
MRRLAFATLLSLGLAAATFAGPAFAAHPMEGTFAVQGANPGATGEPYGGTVTVKFSGEVFDITWTMGDGTVTGTGIPLGDTLGVAFKSPDGKELGVMMLLLKPDGNLTGKWATVGGARLGDEDWIRKPQ